MKPISRRDSGAPLNLLDTLAAAADAQKNIVMLPIDSITVDQRLQVRVDGLHAETVEKYVTALENGENLREIRVYKLADGTLLLSSGFHRIEAYRRSGYEEIPAELIPGTRQEAIEDALEDNRRHGLPLTTRDLKSFLLERLQDGSWVGVSQRVLAQRLGVSHTAIGKWLSEVATGNQFPVEQKTTGADGKTRNTQKIREANQQRAKPEITPGIKPVSDEALKPRSEAQAKNQIAYLKGEIDYTMMLIEQQQRKEHPDKQYLADLNKRLSVLQQRRDAIAATLPTQPDTVKQVTVDWSGETPAVREMTSADKARGIINKMGGLLEELSDTLRRDGDEWTVEEWDNISAAFQTFLNRCQALVTEE